MHIVLLSHCVKKSMVTEYDHCVFHDSMSSILLLEIVFLCTVMFFGDSICATSLGTQIQQQNKVNDFCW